MSYKDNLPKTMEELKALPFDERHDYGQNTRNTRLNGKCDHFGIIFNVTA